MGDAAADLETIAIHVGKKHDCLTETQSDKRLEQESTRAHRLWVNVLLLQLAAQHLHLGEHDRVLLLLGLGLANALHQLLCLKRSRKNPTRHVEVRTRSRTASEHSYGCMCMERGCAKKAWIVIREARGRRPGLAWQGGVEKRHI